MRRYLAGKDFELTCSVLGMDLAAVLTRSRIQLGQSALADAQFSASEIARFFSTVVAEYDGDDIHFRVAKELVGNIHGTGELAFLVSSTLGEATRRLAKMKSWIKPVIYEIGDSKGSFEIRVKSIAAEFPMSALQEISCFIYTMELFRLHSGQSISARHIQITDSVPHLDQISKDLGCTIKISDSNAMIFDASVRDIPLKPTHAFLSNDLDKEISKRQSQNALQINAHTPISASAKQEIKVRLIDDFSSDSVAKSLSLSKRTFERRLLQEGTSYRQLLEQTRAEMALDYLTSTEYTVTEISYLLGFQEPNSFFRAFKRWYGQAPSAYRQSA